MKKIVLAAKPEQDVSGFASLMKEIFPECEVHIAHCSDHTMDARGCVCPVSSDMSYYTRLSRTERRESILRNGDEKGYDRT